MRYSPQFWGAMKLTSLLAATFAFAALANPALSFADIVEPSHSCRKPVKPFRFDSQWERQNFLDDVDRYKGCIKEFVEEQKEAVRAHEQAAEDAVDEWNSFVRTL